MAVRPSAEATELALIRLMRGCPDGEAFRQEAIGLLRRAVGFDGWCWARLDARNQLPAHGSLADGTGAEAILPRLFRAPYAVQPDPQRLVATLSGETDGTLTHSARWRDLLRPLGHHDELRATLADGGLCWGHLVCYRDLPGSPFTEGQAAVMRRVAPLLGAHMREGWRLGTVGSLIENKPGTLLFDAGLTLLSATRTALMWLETLGWPPSWGLPAFVYALAARAADTGSDVTILVRALHGSWASLDAAPLLPSTAAGSVVVTIGSPAPADVADVLMRAWQLSPRERQVAAAIVSGQGTTETARALCIPWDGGYRGRRGSAYGAAMDIIGAGFGRTGTLSLKAALEQLGYGPCLHMLDVIGNPGQIATWQAVLDGREISWGKLLEGFRSAVDWPTCTYYAELAAAFPAAKVVLTVRPADAWYESMRNTIYAVSLAAAAGKLETGELPPPSPEYTRMIRELLWERTFGGRFGDRDHAIGIYQAHITQVTKTVPTERLLVFQVSEGWQPLARFLGAPVPRAPFPRLNDSATLRRLVGLPPR